MFLAFFFSPNVARMISLWGSRQPWLMQHICIMLGFAHSFEPFGQKQGWEWIVAINGLGFVSVRGCEVSLSCRWGSDAVFQSTETLWRWEQGGGRERKKREGGKRCCSRARMPPTEDPRALTTWLRFRVQAVRGHMYAHFYQVSFFPPVVFSEPISKSPHLLSCHWLFEILIFQGLLWKLAHKTLDFIVLKRYFFSTQLCSTYTTMTWQTAVSEHWLNIVRIICSRCWWICFQLSLYDDQTWLISPFVPPVPFR